MNLREIDKLIAEKVLGHELFNMGAEFGPMPFVRRRTGIEIPLPYYTRDMDSAMEVLELLKAYEPEISWDDENHCWFCILNKACDHISPWPLGRTLAESICLTALKLNGIDDGQEN